MSEVAEGVRTTRAVKLLSERLGVEMPITAEVYAVLYENKSARRAAEAGLKAIVTVRGSRTVEIGRSRRPLAAGGPRAG